MEAIPGLILPPADSPVPPEAAVLYPGLRFLAEGLAFRGMTVESLDEAVERVIPAALKLKQRGATAISIMGTSLTFYKGAAFNQEMTGRVRAATGLPATSLSKGVVDALRIAGAKRPAVATAYSDVLNAALEAFLEENGFGIAAIQGLNLIRATGVVAPERLHDFCTATLAAAPRADALLISCGGLSTLDLIAPLEAEYGVPVVSSTPHGLMDAVRLSGMPARAAGFGRVLASG